MLHFGKPVLQISKNRTGFAPLTNFDQTETQITVNDGIIAYDESWTDGGVPVALDVAAGVAATNAAAANPTSPKPAASIRKNFPRHC